MSDQLSAHDIFDSAPSEESANDIFDSVPELKVKEETKPEKPGIAESALKGAAVPYQHPTAAFQALAEALTTTPNADESIFDVAKRSYRRSLDQTQKEGKEAKEAHPIAATLGAAGSSIPVLASAPQALVPQMVASGGVAAASSPNDIISPEFAKDVVTGEAAGGVGYGIGKGIGKVAEALSPDSLKSGANELAARSLRGTKSQYDKLGAEGRQGLGDYLLKSGVIKPGASVSEMLPTIENRIAEAGQVMGDNVNPETMYSSNELANLGNKEVTEPMAQTTLSDDRVNSLKKVLDSLKTRGEPVLNEAGETADTLIPHEQLKTLESDLGNQAYDPLQREVSAGKAAGERFLDEQVVKGSLNPQEYSAAKDAVASGKMAENLATKGAGKEVANQEFSLGDKAMAMLGKTLPGKIALGAANKLGRERGSSTLAYGMDKLSSLLSESPESFQQFAAPLQAAAQRGTESLAVAHFLLSQRNPEYQQLMDSLQNPK